MPKKRAKVASSAGQSIITGLREAVAWAEGKDIAVRKTTVNIPRVNVRDVRERLNLSQDKFAVKFGFPPATVRNWEQGRRQPELPARILLAVIDKHPEVVEEILQGTAA